MDVICEGYIFECQHGNMSWCSSIVILVLKIYSNEQTTLAREGRIDYNSILLISTAFPRC
jgi:hypothetical protein